MKTLLKEYIKHIVSEIISEQFYRKTKPVSMFSSYHSGGGGGGGGGGGSYYDHDYTISPEGNVDIMGVPSYDSNDSGGLDEQDDGGDGGDGDI